MPGMPALPPGMANPMGGDRKSVEYIKGARMRTDMDYDTRKMTGAKKRITTTTITQCDKQRRVTFNNDKKSYYSEPMAGVTAADVKATTSKTVKKGGYVVMAVTVTDTGERAKLFGFDAKHLKQVMTITPGPDSCQKETFKIEMDGWYADLPQFSCPLRRKPREFQMDSNCFDDVEYRMKGEVTGFPVKEIKTMTMQGMTVILEEEVVSIERVPLTDDLFEAPIGYKAANSIREIEDDSAGDARGSFDPNAETAQTRSNTPTLALPRAGVEKTGPVGKRVGVIRIGIVKPAVQLADKDSAENASGVSEAIAGLFEEKLTKQNVEVVMLNSDTEASGSQCDYVVQSTVSQKHAGGGMLGQMMGLPSFGKPKAPDTTPATPASAALQGSLSGAVKMKDEFTYDFKLVDMNRTPSVTKAGKVKTAYPGEDPLTPLIREVSAQILAKVGGSGR